MAQIIGALFVIVGGALIVIATVFVAAVFGGTIVWYLWPVVMVPVFHFPELSWIQAVALTWLCGLLIKSNVTTEKKS